MELVFLIIFNRIHIFFCLQLFWYYFFKLKQTYIYINGFDITFLFLIIQKLYAKRFPIFSIFIKHLAKQIESISKSYWKEKAHTRVPRKLFSTFPFIIIIYISLILSFTIFIELLAQTDRTSRYPVTGKGRKHTFLFLRQTIFSIFLFSRYYLYLSTSSREWIEFYKHYGGKRAYIFFFFFDFPRPVEFRKAAIVGIVISHIYEAVHKRRSFVKLRVQIRA